MRNKQVEKPNEEHLEHLLHTDVATHSEPRVMFGSVMRSTFARLLECDVTKCQHSSNDTYFTRTSRT